MKKTNKTYKEIESIEEFLDNGWSFINCCFQDIDFRVLPIRWDRIHLENCTFLGCKFHKKDINLLLLKNTLIFPAVNHIPYNPYRKSLYTWQELYNKSSHENAVTIDEEIYYHFSHYRYQNDITEALYQRIHDHSIDDALYEILGNRKDGSFQKKAVGIMGGHGTKRSSPFYKKVAEVSFILSKKGYLIVSGGGPGIMEAANLGAYMANYSKPELSTALEIIDGNISYNHPEYFKTALEVLNNFPHGKENLAIPTWFYGHEPSNLFASHIAKYFSNSIREDTLLAIALHGIVFAPGSAGTNQEIFMDLSQNHYQTFGYYSPMVFLGKKHYVEETKIFPVIKNFVENNPYQDMLFVEDDVYKICKFIEKNPPKK